MTRPDQLINALRKLLPGATFRIASCRNWCSITFVGQQLTIIAEFEKSKQVQMFATSLPEHEFTLPDVIVADIFVVDMRNDGEVVRLQIDALLLDK